MKARKWYHQFEPSTVWVGSYAVEILNLGHFLSQLSLSRCFQTRERKVVGGTFPCFHVRCELCACPGRTVLQPLVVQHCVQWDSLGAPVEYIITKGFGNGDWGSENQLPIFLILSTLKTASKFLLLTRCHYGVQILDLVWIIRSSLLPLIYNSSKSSRLSLLHLLRDWSQSHLPDKKLSQIGICFYWFYITLKFFYNHNGLKRRVHPRAEREWKQNIRMGPCQEWAGASSYQLTRARVLFLLWSSHLCFHAQALSLWDDLSVTVLTGNMEQPAGWLKILWRNHVQLCGQG